LSIDIRNGTDTDATFTFYMAIPVAFVPAAAADQIVFSGLEPTKDDTQSEGKTRWRLGSKRGTLTGKDSSVTMTLSNITAASAGQQTIELEWRRGTDVVGSTSLPVDVLADNDEPRIVSFEAKPHIVIWRQDAKSPVKLAWETDESSIVELRRFETRLLPAAGEASAPRKMPEWSDRDYDFSPILPYELRATGARGSVSRWLFVRVQEPGWNRIECSQGAPSLLLNDADKTLYGVFARDGEAAVYRLDLETGGLGRKDTFCCKVPEEMNESPGAFFRNRIWLVGGSQIDLDPRVCSNKVWWFDPKSKETGVIESAGSAAMWTARTGHACATFGGKLWILGGVDADGNTLSDVWCFDGNIWQESEALGRPLCLLAATEFDQRLWVYGGVDAPFGTPQSGVWYRSSRDAAWQQMRFNTRVGEPPVTNPGSGDPFASALCVDKTRSVPMLCGLATFQKDIGIASEMFTLSGVNYVNNTADVRERSAIPPQKGWPTTVDARLQQAFRLSAVGFKSSIFVVSLVYGAGSRSLSYRVQS
jgi:hypothetical protein